MDNLAGRFEKYAVNVARAKGAWFYDQNGKRTLDHLLGNCCQTLGHCHDRIVAAIEHQAKLALNVGDHAVEGTRELTDRICRIAKKDQLRFLNSGSEACHLAIRLARAVTGRRTILKFDGHYHGWFAEELARFIPDISYGAGLDPAPEVVSIPWNDPRLLELAVANIGESLAAIICEPILCHAGVVPPIPGFLELLRSKADEVGALLIFDECITGFRVAMGGAQEYCGVQSDLVIYAKAISQGVPLSVCAGTKEAMQPLAEGATYQGGTYDGHPLGLAVAAETLNIFEDERTHQKLAATGKTLSTGITEAFHEYGVPAICQSVPGAFQIFFTTCPALVSHAQVFNESNVQLNKALVLELWEQGLYLGRGDVRRSAGASWMGQWFYSSAHGEFEIEFALDAVRRVIKSGKLDHALKGELAA